jgi:hypothetical protein
MELTTEDNGKDLQKGDIVFIKFEVMENPTACGDVRLRYFARNGFSEYAASSINAIFIKRPQTRFVKNLLNRIFGDK